MLNHYFVDLLAYKKKNKSEQPPLFPSVFTQHQVDPSSSQAVTHGPTPATDAEPCTHFGPASPPIGWLGAHTAPAPWWVVKDP